MVGRVVVRGVSVESTGQACVCWRVVLKCSSAFSSCVALVKSQAVSFKWPMCTTVIKVYYLMLSLVVSIESCAYGQHDE